MNTSFSRFKGLSSRLPYQLIRALHIANDMNGSLRFKFLYENIFKKTPPPPKKGLVPFLISNPFYSPY